MKLTNLFAMENLPISQFSAIFTKMINQIDEGVLIVDANRKGMPVIFANDGFSKITGYKPEDIIGKNPKFLVGDNSDTKTLKLIRECIKTKVKGSFTVLNYKKNGEKFWNHLTIAPVFDKQNNLTQWIGIERDITLLLKTRQSETETQSMVTTINTISDLVNNFLNYISFFKNSCETIPNIDRDLLNEFDDVYEKFINDIKILYTAVKYKEKKLGDDFSVLDFE